MILTGAWLPWSRPSRTPQSLSNFHSNPEFKCLCLTPAVSSPTSLESPAAGPGVVDRGKDKEPGIPTHPVGDPNSDKLPTAGTAEPEFLK